MSEIITELSDVENEDKKLGKELIILLRKQNLLLISQLQQHHSQ